MAGEILRQRREELGRDIRDIADLLKIKADYLIAIENDSFEKLPAPVYTTGYIRCYAGYLSVEPGPIIEVYTRNLSQPASTTIIPVGYSHKKTPRFLYVIAAIIVFGASGYLLLPVVKSLVGQRQHAAVQHDPAGKTARDVPVAAPPPAAAPAQHQLTTEAVELTWLMVRFTDGRTEETLMKPGETKSWDFSEQLVMKTGNAGGIRLRLDGTDLGVAGNSGEVKTITLPPQ